MGETAPVAAALAPWIESTRTRAAELSRGAPAWLAALRIRAAEEFARVGFPTRRDEEWRYTSVKPIVEGPFRAAPAGASAVVDLARIAAGAPDRPVIVFVDGAYREDLSRLAGLPAGIVVEPIATAVARGGDSLERALADAPAGVHPFRALNTASFADGAHVRAEPGVVCPRPIRVLSIGGAGGPGAAHLRHRVSIGAGARVTLVEEYRSVAPLLVNAVTDIELGCGARLDRVHIVDEDPRAHHIGFLSVRQEGESRFHDLFLATGGAIVRNEIDVLLDGEHAECTLNGLYHADGDRQVDNHTLLRHARANCRSWEVYRGILDGRARGIFTGKIHVWPDAQKTDAKQSSNSLLLSRDAEADTRPRLEIHADDVKCTHGATVGELDETALFYLRSRGIPRDAARRLLVRAFASEVLAALEEEGIRTELEERFVGALERGS